MARKSTPREDNPRVEMINPRFPGQIARPREDEVPAWENQGWTRKG